MTVYPNKFISSTHIPCVLHPQPSRHCTADHNGGLGHGTALGTNRYRRQTTRSVGSQTAPAMLGSQQLEPPAGTDAPTGPERPPWVDGRTGHGAVMVWPARWSHPRRKAIRTTWLFACLRSGCHPSIWVCCYL